LAAQPREDRVDEALVQVVVAVPFESLGGDLGVMHHAVDDAGHAARQRRAGVGHPVAHRIAGPNLDRDASFLAQLFQLLHEGHDEAVKIGARDVFEMAARPDAIAQRILHHAEVHVHGLPARLVELQEDMIVGRRRENARLAEAHVLDQFEVARIGANPAGDLGERVAAFEAAADCLLIAVAVEEELALPDQPARPAQPVQQIIQVHDVVDLEGRQRLLPVAERGVRNPQLVGRHHRHASMIERNLRHRVVVEDVAEKFRLRDVLQLIDVVILFERIGPGIESEHVRDTSWASLGRSTVSFACASCPIMPQDRERGKGASGVGCTTRLWERREGR